MLELRFKGYLSESNRAGTKRPITKRPMQQNAQCNKTPNATKRPMLQNAQCNKSPKIKYHSINVGLLKITSAVPSTTLYFSKSGIFGLKKVSNGIFKNSINKIKEVPQKKKKKIDEQRNQ